MLAFDIERLPFGLEVAAYGNFQPLLVLALLWGAPRRSGPLWVALAASLKPGQVYFAGFDMSPNTAQAVKEGFQNLVIDQQPYLQGYLPILNICLTKKYGRY